MLLEGWNRDFRVCYPKPLAPHQHTENAWATLFSLVEIHSFFFPASFNLGTPPNHPQMASSISTLPGASMFQGLFRLSHGPLMIKVFAETLGEVLCVEGCKVT